MPTLPFSLWNLIKIYKTRQQSPPPPTIDLTSIYIGATAQSSQKKLTSHYFKFHHPRDVSTKFQSKYLSNSIKNIWNLVSHPLSYQTNHEPLLFLNHDGRKPKLHQDRVHEQSRGSSVAVGEGVNVDEFVMRDGGKFDGMKLAGLLWVHPGQKVVHQNLNFVRAGRDVVTDVDLRSTEYSALDGVDVTQNPLVDLEDVIKWYVIISKTTKAWLRGDFKG